jgi:putative ABC transport system permease protein
VPNWNEAIRERLAELRLDPVRESEIVEEVSQHISDRYEELLADGATENEAFSSALAEFAENDELIRELRQVERAVRREPPLFAPASTGNIAADLWQDLRYALRTIRKAPGFTAISVLALALGIGANTAIFTVVNAVLLRPLPYPQSEKLVELGRAFPGSEFGGNLSETKFVFLHDNNQSFESLTATQEMGSNTYVSDDTQTDFVRGMIVSADFFRVMSVAPARGRSFTKKEDSPGGERVVVLGDSLWRRRFGSDEAIIGKTIALNGNAFTVVGIMPPGFEYYGAQDVFVPMQMNPASKNEGHNWSVIGRLRPGVTADQAQSEAGLLFEKFRSIYPQQVQRNETFGARTWRVNMTGSVGELLWILLGAVSLVLLIACANVANLQLTRAAARQKEIAIRMAIGGGSWRLIRQLLTEGVVLALLGGSAGLLLAIWGLNAMRQLLPEGLIPRVEEVSLDWRVLSFCLAVSLLTGIVFSLAPAWHLLRVNLNGALKEGTNKIGAGVARGRLRSILVVVEVALALALTVGAGLLLRTFANLRGIEPGFATQNLLGFEISPRGKSYDTVAKINDLYFRGLERFRNLPGVEAAAVTSRLPLDAQFNLPYRLRGQNQFAGAVQYRLITPDYFRVMKMALRKGRQFDANDTGSSEPVVIVNEAFVNRNFTGREALDQQLCIGCDKFDPAMRRIVGVVNDTKQKSLGDISPATVFVPLTQAAGEMRGILRQASFVFRTAGDPLLLSPAIRSEVDALDPSLSVRNLHSMDQLVSRSIAPQRFNFSLLSLFSGLGLLLAAVGIYAVMAYNVSQRTHEIGLRMALGAQGHQVLGLVLKQGMRLGLIGVVLGLATSYAVTRLLKNLLFGVSATDPVTLTVVALLLIGATLLACYFPARRATRVDPLVALRHE